jgi:hypothetical protein
MYLNKVGLPFVTVKMLDEMKRGCNSVNCPPSMLSATNPRKRIRGDALAKLSD